MCGFSGFIHYGSGGLDRAARLRVLRAMGAALAHRGPDDEQFYDDGTLALVFRRLSIVDVAGGQQPLYSEDASRLLVCNGEIYNHAEVRQALQPHHAFRTGSDSEVLLHGHAQWGEGVLQRVRGMFALAHWDSRERRLLLARDRLGIKPLYIGHLPHGLLFGSELKALLAHPDCPREMDWTELDANPIAHARTPTYLKGIDFLPGGSYLVAQPDGRRPQVRSYWSLEPHLGSAPFGTDARRYVAHFDELLESAVAEHLQGEAGIGLHLSGGVDSSLVAAVAGRLRPGLPSYTIVERSNYLAGDATAAADVAARLGLDWHPVLFDYQDLLAGGRLGLDTLEQAGWVMDSPLFDIEWIFKHALNRLMRERHPELKVLLLGQGADEFSGGYSTRIDAPHAHWNAYIRDEVQHFLGLGAASQPLRDGHHSVFLGRRVHTPGLTPYQEMMLLMPRQLQAHNLWHEDRTSAAFGMEARVPFLDHRIVEFFASVPAQLHRKLFWNKSIIRQTLRKRLPSYDQERPKIGFCWTNDSRSLDILIQGIARQAVGPFRSRYLADPQYPFDRAATERLIQRLENRLPGFKSASVELLGQMSAAVFRRHVIETAAGRALRPPAASVLALEIIAPARWPELARHFADEPVQRFDWLAEHCPTLPPGCGLQRAPAGEGQIRYRLVQGDVVHAEVVLPAAQSWVETLVDGLQDPARVGMSVQDWMVLLGVPREPLTGVLDILLQCGVVTTPQRHTRRSTWSRLRLAMHRHMAHLWPKRRPPSAEPEAAAPEAPAPVAAGWLERLQARRQTLEHELRK